MVDELVRRGGETAVTISETTIGDKITAGNITDSYAAIGAGAQVIVTQIQQALSAVEEMEKSVRVAERLLAEGIQRKLDYYTRLTAAYQAEERSNPYKALLDYELEDAPYFYGRQAAITALRQKIRQGRLTILEADTGSGKTSLLQAGLAARMLADGKFSLYLRPYDLTPEKAIKKAFLPDYETRPELACFRDETMTLRGFLERLIYYLGDRRLVIFLDQFEEFFTEVAPEQRQQFADQLLDCIEADVPARWVLSLRKEYLSELRLFEGLKPFSNRYFLPTFKLEEAQEVITEPAALKGVRYEAGLVERILHDLCQEAKSLQPVQVQLICYTLFDELAGEADPTLITHTLYEKPRGQGAGKPGAEGILTSHLTRVLDNQLQSEERSAAILLLEALVTFDGRRALKSYARLVAELPSLTPTMVTNVLELLVDNRLLRTDRDENNELIYELAHDYLLREIELDPAARAKKLAQQILDQEVRAWQDQPNLRIPGDKLAILNAHQSLLMVDNNAEELLHLSRTTRRNEKLRDIGGLILVVFTIAAVVTLALTSQLPRLFYRPIHSDMVEIPAGLFFMGASETEVANARSIKDVGLQPNAFYLLDNELPQHEIFVDSFEIGKFEVTNREYYQCVRATVCSPPSNSIYTNPQYATLPVTDVNWGQADIYCRWIGGRLPAEAEWEKAARFDSDLPDQRYAWGMDRYKERANVLLYTTAPLPVGSFSPLGDTAIGLADMTGNVWEWVADWFAEDYYQIQPEKNPTGPEQGYWRIARGGSYKSDWVQARITFRNSDNRTGDSAVDLGFRCVR